MLTDGLILAYPEAALDVTIRNQNQNWRPQISTCRLWVILPDVDLILATYPVVALDVTVRNQNQN